MNQAEWCRELVDKLDTYTDNEKSFMLWYLLGDYRRKLSEMADNIGEANGLCLKEDDD